MARLWGSHCCWTQQWSLRQGTYRSRMGGASEANYEVQEVIKVGEVLIWPVQAVDHPVSSRSLPIQPSTENSSEQL